MNFFGAPLCPMIEKLFGPVSSTLRLVCGVGELVLEGMMGDVVNGVVSVRFIGV